MRTLRLSAALLTLALLGALFAPVQAQGVATCPGLTRVLEPFAGERLTVSSTALAFTAATWKPTSTNSTTWARMATVSVEADEIRFTLHGSNPTASAGHLVPTGTYLTVCGIDALTGWRAIRVTTDATIQVTYWRVPQ
jgi:hypothetical protein